ncbi:sulfotransferase [Nocardioides sp. DS6]|uniref:Sulfotransferase n=1 Tax=Nocardioides eburneus TaxID=3231482 RepID=A0ABV3SW64_9ACTN
MSVYDGTPLFIVGAPRSGTTLMKTALRGFDGVYLLPEEFQILGLFLRAAAHEDPRSLVRRIEESAFGSHMKDRGLWPDPELLASAIRGTNPGAAFESVVLSFAEKEGRLRPLFWGDKTPENIFELDLISATWPDARVINIVRDPRDTALSMNRAWGRSWLRSAVIWRDAAAAAATFALTHPDRFTEVRYEDLTARPEETLGRVASWLGVKFDTGALGVIQTGERWGRAATSRGVRQTESAWRTAVDPRHLRKIEAICYYQMQACGYTPVLATRAEAPRAWYTRCAAIADAARVVRSYARERGWRGAVSYKWRQWRTDPR